MDLCQTPQDVTKNATAEKNEGTDEEKEQKTDQQHSSKLCQINEVALRRARLVLGWVTVYEQVNHLSMKPAS